jgi:transposase, IS5 family
MYQKQGQHFISAENFTLPFKGKLEEDNRWVIMASSILWSELEQECNSNFSVDVEAPIESFRMALGTLFIQEKLGMSDKETVELIKENPYLQYFVGLPSYRNEVLLNVSMLANFRSKISKELINKAKRQVMNKIRSS